MRKKLFITGFFLLITDMVLRQAPEPQKGSGEPASTMGEHFYSASQFLGELPITKLALACIAAGVVVGLFDKYLRKET